MAIAGVQGVSRGQHTITTTRRGSGEGHSRAADLIGRDWSAPTKPGSVVGRGLHVLGPACSVDGATRRVLWDSLFLARLASGIVIGQPL